MFQTEVVEKINAHFILVLDFENYAEYRIMWKNFVEPYRPQTTLCRVLTACWIRKATNTHSELCNNYCFPAATIVARTLPNVTLYVRCVSWLEFSVFRQLTDDISACQDVEPRCPPHKLSVRTLRCNRPKAKPPNPRSFTCYRQQNLC